MNKDLRIVFMGTPDFAVASLDAIVKANYNVVGVITATDKPAGRGRKTQESAVKKYALKNNLKVLQPKNLKDEDFLKTLQSLNANIQVVVAFRMLPKVVWQMPKYGTFNLHASLLPNYRGAAPINWAIINGENKTGVTTFFIDEKIDTGAMIVQKEINIKEHETVGELHDILMTVGSNLVLDTLKLINMGDVETTIQPKLSNLKSAPKLNKNNCKIDWTDTIDNIYNKIRGLNPHPAAWCTLINNNQESTVKIYKCIKVLEAHNNQNGKIVADKKSLKVYASKGYLDIKEIQLPGKKKMDIKSLLNGYKFEKDAKLL